MSGEKTHSCISCSQVSILLAVKSLFLLKILFLSSFSWHCLDSCLLEKWKMEGQKSLWLRKVKGPPRWVGSAPGQVRRNKNFFKQQDGRDSPRPGLKTGHWGSLWDAVAFSCFQAGTTQAGWDVRASSLPPWAVAPAKADKQGLFWIVLHSLMYQLQFSHLFKCVHDNWVLWSSHELTCFHLMQ